jgi:hypothetical protein
MWLFATCCVKVVQLLQALTRTWLAHYANHHFPILQPKIVAQPQLPKLHYTITQKSHFNYNFFYDHCDYLAMILELCDIELYPSTSLQGSNVQYFQYKLELHILLFLVFRELWNIIVN